MVLLLDDFHNIQTVRIPDNLKLSKAMHMASAILVVHQYKPHYGYTLCWILQQLVCTGEHREGQMPYESFLTTFRLSGMRRKGNFNVHCKGGII